MLVGTFGWTAWQAHGIVVAGAYVSSSNLALSVEQFVARTIETIDLTLRAAGDAAAEGKARPGIEALLAQRLSESPQIARLFVIGPDGRERFAAGAPPTRATDFSEARFFERARSDAGLQLVLDEAEAGAGPERQIILSRRIIRRDGSFGGVVAAVLNRDYIQRFLFVLDIGRHGVITLSTSDGTTLVRWPYVATEVGRNYGASPLFARWVPEVSSAVIPLRSEADGLRRIVGYQRVEKLPLVVAVALSQDEALAGWRRTTAIEAALCLAFLLILGWLALRLDRELRARLAAHRRLGETVEALEKARLAAEQSSRVKSQFLANMSHELRTPLNAIIGFSELIRSAQMGPVSLRYRDYAEDICSSGKHLLSLINDVLDLSKVEAGGLELQEEVVELHQVMADCSKLIAHRVSAGALDFRIDAPADLPSVIGDALRLRQIVLNLLSNAVKFTRGGGRVVLSAAVTADGGVALSVSDTGIGMDPAEIEIALEPFRQLEDSLNRRFEGTGLGLPLVRRLTELHGGTLTITSAKGRGTVATVKLPPHRVSRPAAAERPAATRHIAG